LEDMWFCRMGSAKLLKHEVAWEVGRQAAQNFRRAVMIGLFPVRAFWSGMSMGRFYGEAGRHDEQKFEAAKKQSRTILQSARLYEGGEMKLAGFYEFDFSQIYYAQLVSTWTAFEQLAGDLWERAVNKHPDGLAKLTGKWPKAVLQQQKKAGKLRVSASSLASPQVQEPTEKMMKLEVLADRGFNVSDQMGTIWRNERYNFQMLQSIREAFVEAFWADHHDIRASILDPSIKALNLARNVIVHKGAIIDPEFMEGADGMRIFDSEVLGKPLTINTIKLRDLTVPVVKASYNLLRAVGMWLMSH
jgi:hypothetical protein